MGSIRVCGKSGMNPVKPSKLAVNSHNLGYWIIAFINNAFGIVLGDTVSCSLWDIVEGADN